MKNLFILLLSFFAFSVTAQTANYTHTISRTDAKRFEENESHIYDIGIDTLTGSNDTLLIQFDRTFPAFYGITYTGVLAASSTSTTLKAELLGRNKSSETWVIIDDVNVTTEGSTTTLTADLNYMYLALRYVSTTGNAHVNSTILLKKKSSSASAGGGASYLVYTALLSQSGTDAPVATVLENTLGVTVTWSYGNVGSYTGTYSATLSGDIYVDEKKRYLVFPFDGAITMSLSSNSTVIDISTFDHVNETGIDGAMTSVPIQIRLYQ